MKIYMSVYVKIYLFLFCLICLSSCSTFQARMNQEWEEKNRLLSLDITKLEGHYLNKMGSENMLLWNLLTGQYSLPENVVGLKTLNGNLILATLNIEGKDSIEELIEYSVEGRHLRLRKRRDILKPAFPLFWFYSTELILLGITPENRLCVLRHASSTMFVGPIPIFGGGGGPGIEYEYEKIE